MPRPSPSGIGSPRSSSAAGVEPLRHERPVADEEQVARRREDDLRGSLHDRPGLARVESAHPERVLCGIGHQHVVQEMAAVREERRPARPALALGRVGRHQRLAHASAGVDHPDRVVAAAVEQDHARRPPRAVGSVLRVADRLHRAPGHRHAPQLPPGHERDRAAVGRPDRAQRAVGARNRAATRARRAAAARAPSSRRRRRRRRRACARRATARAGPRPGRPRGS